MPQKGINTWNDFWACFTLKTIWSRMTLQVPKLILLLWECFWTQDTCVRVNTMLFSLMLSYTVFDYKTLATNIAEVSSFRLLNPNFICWKNISILQIIFCVRIIGKESQLITCTAMQWWPTACVPEIISKLHCNIIRNIFFKKLDKMWADNIITKCNRKNKLFLINFNSWYFYQAGESIQTAVYTFGSVPILTVPKYGARMWYQHNMIRN
jgi:hypothetical protein